MKNFKVAVAQISSLRGDIDSNIKTHINATIKAGKQEVSLLVFPELSLSGYELDLGKSLAFTTNDIRLEPLKQVSKKSGVHIVVGAPLVSEPLPKLGMISISPKGDILTYDKMYLHGEEERKYFSAGESVQILEIEEQRVALAICADTVEPRHIEACYKEKADIYIAGVLLSKDGYKEDAKIFEKNAKKYNMLVAISNYNQATGGWIPAGKSAIWSPSEKIGAADEVQNALVVAEQSADGWLSKIIELN